MENLRYKVIQKLYYWVRKDILDEFIVSMEIQEAKFVEYKCRQFIVGFACLSRFTHPNALIFHSHIGETISHVP